MKKLAKALSAIGAAALTAGLVPYRFKSDKETGSFEMGALLWSLKKTTSAEKDNYTIELLPLMRGAEEPADVEIPFEEGAAEDAPAEEIAEEETADPEAAAEPAEKVAEEIADEADEPEE